MSVLVRTWEAFSGFMKAHFAPSLRAILSPLDAWLNSLPDWSGKVCALGLFVLACLWVFTLKREYIYLGAPDKAGWRDLRWWAVVFLLPYVAIYLFF